MYKMPKILKNTQIDVYELVDLLDQQFKTLKNMGADI